MKNAPYSSISCNFDLRGVCGGGLTTNTGQGCSLGSRGFGCTSVGISVALPAVASVCGPSSGGSIAQIRQVSGATRAGRLLRAQIVYEHCSSHDRNHCKGPFAAYSTYLMSK